MTSQSLSFSFRHPFFAFLLVTLLCQGCYSSSQGPDATGTGIVLMDGSPLAKVLVQFEPVDPAGRGSFGTTDDSGKFQLRFNSEHLGIQSGEYTVVIKSSGGSDNPDDKTNSVSIPARYNTKTTLKETINPGKNTFEFQLTSNAK